ncbi:hypothetical protein [Phyllobacterium sophorae]|uniref:hypothetical protein n=1 Tax=Phyllobacterium sophorae TaxID=1520277 RepID=UPI0013AF9BAC|nr:hypothetical protein [Phyllobacterium sophorae]
MDHIRFSECLAYLFWSQETLADILECDRYLGRAWAEGRQPVAFGVPVRSKAATSTARS